MRPGPIHLLTCPRCGAFAKDRTIGSGSSMGARFWTDGKGDMPMLPQRPEVARCQACGLVHFPKDATRAGTMTIVEELGAQSYALRVTAIRRKSIPLFSLLRLKVGAWSEEALFAALPVTVATGLTHLQAGSRAEVLEKMGAEVEYVVTIREGYEGPTPREWIEAPDLAPPGERDLLATLARGDFAPNREAVLTLRIKAWQAGNDARRGADSVAAVAWSNEAAENLEALVALLSEDDPDERLMKAEALRELGRFETCLALLARPLPGKYEIVVRTIRSLAERNVPGVAELRGSF
ncbi:hypothetical protein KEG38_27000 [Polyangium jinanense]|uniref:hypothetical protein n=1 Tax=Polyangium jinanense TaxID=2829994 RepID=UPI0023418144|nr:hypothetical protein [Polyangium jinanense]MDC3957536.1 hypothetical protein [Polyangium jinanense]